LDTKKVETAPSYNRTPWMIDADKCLNFTMCSITRAKREQIVAECTATLEGEYNERLKIFTDGSLKDETTIKKTEREVRQRYLMPNKKPLSKQFIYPKGKGTLIATDSLNVQ
jgi:hypothetical protein